MASGIEIFRAAARATIAEARQAHIDLAKREHARIMADKPKPERFSRKVDGATGQREEAVKSGGRIEYHYSRLDSVVQAAMEILFELSPVLSGEYRNAHTIFVDGAAVRNLAAWDGSGEVIVANMLPYSRKIEAGKMKMRVPGSDHVYQQAEFMMRQRFGNQARIRFVYRGFVSGAVASGKANGKSQNRYPALEIEAIK